MNNILDIVKRHLEPSMQMLSNVITICPDELWINNQYGFPIWKRVLHTLESIDYWLNEFDKYYFDEIGKDVSPELKVYCKDILSKEEMNQYYKKVMRKCDKISSQESEISILDSSLQKNYTILDIILTQIRHIQINIGYCNNCFNQFGINGVKWIGFAED